MRPQEYPPMICILMSTYNGEKFLTEQLQSIEDQTHKNWRLVISDDGSSDNTLAIAKQFQQKWGNDRLEIRQGPQQGFCQNFLSMACDSDIRADLYAFSDQDDIWMADKLARAVAYFKASNESQLPRAYGSRTQIVDEALSPLGFSPEFTMPSSFRNALVQSIAGGNTQVFNQATKQLFEQAGRQKVVSHDWWLYQIVKGAGGIFYYDPSPSLLYRQHSNAIVGANSSFRSKIKRIFYVFNGRFKNWNDINYAALCNIRHLLTKDSQDILDIFGTFRNAHLKDRVRLLEVCGLYRQTWQGTFSLWLATIIHKI
ncbi:MAG: glycosyltransferase family 2 protein [Piscirickettsiaceae bacterium]|nr:glycosyltransferase family 2 protein [Piscirickettsiaceae bacterium]